MDTFGLPFSPQFEKYQFDGNSQTNGASWYTWNRPLGKSHITMFLLGAGGGGAVPTIAVTSGGDGGGSGAQTVVTMPLDLLPPRLYISVGQAKTGDGVNTYVATIPSAATGAPPTTVAIAQGGVAGTGSSAGGSIATVGTMPLGWPFAWALAGSAGSGGGGNNTVGTSINSPIVGLRVTGGGGGAGLPTSGAGKTGGGFTGSSNAISYLQPVTGGAGGSSGTTPPSPGSDGYVIPEAGLFFVGGLGGGSTNFSASGAGLVQAAGGNGAPGCGGGGAGAAATGSTVAAASYGGPGLVIFWVY